MTTLTTEDIVKMAKQAGASRFFSKESVELGLTSTVKIEAFAKLVEDKVRDYIIEKNKPVLQSVNDYIKKLEDEVTRLRGEA